MHVLFQICIQSFSVLGIEIKIIKKKINNVDFKILL
jgi:hypothetical protein